MKADPAETMTVELSSQVLTGLAELSARSRRPAADLAGEAIADYVERELAIVEGIARGLADMEAGRVTSHSDAIARLRKTVADASRQ